MLSQITLLATYCLGLVTSLAMPAEGSALSVLVSLIALACLLAPVVGAWYCHKQQEAKKEYADDDSEPDDKTEEMVEVEEAVEREPNPLAPA